MRALFLVLVCGIFSLSLLAIPGVQADNRWCDSNFVTRYNVNITNNAQESLPLNYTLTVELPLDKGLSNISRVYFQGAGCQELDRTNETGFDQPTVLISFASRRNISVGGFDSDYFIYFNPNQSIGAIKDNKTNIYNFSEDFDRYLGGELRQQGSWSGDPNRFFINSRNQTNPFQGQNALNITYTAGDSNIFHALDTLKQARIQFVFNTSSQNGNTRFGVGLYENNISARRGLLEIFYNSGTNQIRWLNGSGLVSILSGTADNQWYRLSIDINKTSAKVLVNGLEYVSGLLPSSGFNDGFKNISVDFYDAAGINALSKMYLDELRVKNLILPEPSFSVSSSTSINIFNCSATSNTKVLNFSFFDENNFSYVIGTLEATFSNQNSTNISLKIVNQTEIYICATPDGQKYNMTAKYYIKTTNTTTDERWYYLSETLLSNASMLSFKLYTIAQELATPTEFSALDGAQNPQSGVIIKTLRYYPATNDYLTVAMGKTGFDGKVSIPLKFFEYYTIIMEKNGVVISTQGPQMITSSPQILFTTTSSPVYFFKTFNGVSFACPFNTVSDTLVCILSDTSGCLQSSALSVYAKRPFNNTLTVCTDSASGPTASLSCGVTAYNTSELFFVLQGNFLCSGSSGSSSQVISSGSLDLSTSAVQWGVMGIFASLMLVMVLSMSGISDPRLMVIFGYLGVVLSRIFGFLPLNTPSIMGLGIAVIIIVYFINKE